MIGQVLEYAAYLWEWPFDRFNGLFLNRAKKSLEQLFSEKKVSEGWTYEGFRQATERNLRSGSFRLLIAVDKMNPELERTIGYSNRQGAAIRLQAIEMSMYGKEGLQILVPELHGQALNPALPETELEPSLEELLQLADKRHARPLLDAFREEIRKVWPDERPSKRFGGSLRYFNEKLIFGVSVAGNFLTPPTPEGQLDIWIRTGNLSQSTGVPEFQVRDTLKADAPVLGAVRARQRNRLRDQTPLRGEKICGAVNEVGHRIATHTRIAKLPYSLLRCPLATLAEMRLLDGAAETMLKLINVARPLIDEFYSNS